MGLLLAIFLAFAQVATVSAVILLGIAAVSRARRAALLWLLAVITRRRLPLALELEALGDGMLRRDRGKLNAVVDRVRSGTSLAQALAVSPGLISDDAILLAHVGERAGCLGEAFTAEAERLARAREEAVTSTTSPSLAFMYLVLVPLVIPIILTFLMVFIVPKLEKIFDDFGAELPWATERLIKSSDFLLQYWYIGAASLVAGVSCAGVLLVLANAYAWDLRLPRWLTPGGRSRRASLALRALALPAAAGRPLSDALDPMANSASDASDRWRFGRLRERFQAGGNLWQGLADERLITSRDARFLGAAETAGNLDWALALLSDRIDDRRRRRFAMLIEFAQPLIVLMLGALILFICLGIFLPLVKLINDLS
ncbi:MAG: type II secretion system F family protein [Planctomycetaceae bacterium]|nr:type II secretion system F family protein [Planctomycetaceae bacterium]